MLAKVIMIVGLSILAVIAMFFLGKCMDRGNTEEPTEKKG